MAPVAGFNAKAGIGATSTVDKPLDFLSETLAANEVVLDRAGLRGTREHPVEVLRLGTRRPGGQLIMQPTAVEWSNLLPWILGTDASGTTYALAETCQARYLTIDRSDGTDGKVFTYDGVKVNRATIRASQGELLTCTLDLEALDETVGNAGTFPAITLDTTTTPFVFSDCAITVGGTTYTSRDFELTIDNKLDVDRFHNSNVRTALIAQDREIMVGLNPGYGDAEALYGTGSVAGAAVVATFTNGAVSLVFSLVKVVFPREKGPNAAGKSEIMLPLRGKAHKSGSTLSLVTTLDSTP